MNEPEKFHQYFRMSFLSNFLHCVRRTLFKRRKFGIKLGNFSSHVTRISKLFETCGVELSENVLRDINMITKSNNI